MSYRKLLAAMADDDEFTLIERDALRAIANDSYNPPSIASTSGGGDSLYTTEDVCEVLRISRSQFYERDLHKQLAPVPGFTRKHPRYSEEAVQKLIAQNRARAEAIKEVSHAP